MRKALREATPEEAAEVALIREHPSWPLLKARWLDALEEERYDLGKTLLVPQSSVDPVYIARRQGYWQGIRAVLDTPEFAFRMLGAENAEEARSE